MFLGTALRLSFIEVELLIGLGGFIAYQIQTNSECYEIYSGVSPRVLRSVDERRRIQIIG
jgi:hypothetical protein